MSKIQWTDKTWNPVTGCTKVSQGCKNCYAETIADRFFAKQYPANADGSPRKFTDVRCHPERLDQPLHWKKPCMVFVNSMSDLFHEDVPEEFITQVWEAMDQAPQHTFQVLTKRAVRLYEYMTEFFGRNPLPNVWLGVSVEDQQRADERIPLLQRTPAAIRFLSVEPQLEEIWIENHLMGQTSCGRPNWVICGGESGPGARPFNLAWAESLLAQCRVAGVPFFMKQVGARVESGCVIEQMRDRKGGDPAEWPEALRVREFPAAPGLAPQDARRKS